MARYTTAYCEFVERLTEVEMLRRFAASRERRDAVTLRAEINTLCRGAVVLLSAHLEAFVRELGEVALDSMHVKQVPRTQLSSALYYHISQDILDELRDTSDPRKVGDKLFSFLQRDLPYWSRSGPFPQPIPTDLFNKGFSSPAFRKIRKYFNRFGYTNYAHDLAHFLKATYTPTVNMVDHLVDTRNKIAHGDPQASKTPSEVAQMMLLIRSFCGATDAVFATWWKTQFCPIR